MLAPPVAQLVLAAVGLPIAELIVAAILGTVTAPTWIRWLLAARGSSAPPPPGHHPTGPGDRADIVSVSE